MSLLAILLTLAGVALVAGLAIPLWFARHDVTLDNAALLLARDLRAAQNRAAFLRLSARFELHEHGWSATLSGGEPLVRAGHDEPIVRRLDADGVFEGVTLGAIQFGSDDAVEFGSEGQALESGSVELWFRDECRRLLLIAPHGEVRIVGLEQAWNDDQH